MKATQVGYSASSPTFRLITSSEEFGIYLNYVRKLGFEETPDYDFLRELFAKIMKNNNEVDDGIFDWSLLNGVCSRATLPPRLIKLSGGKGWEASMVCRSTYDQSAMN